MTDQLPVLIGDDKQAVVRSTTGLPMISAEQYQHVGRYAGAIVMSVFEQIGGADRMARWADTNPTDYYTKLFPKMISRSQQVDISGTLTIDDAITRLEGRSAPMGEFTEYEEYSQSDDQQYDL